MGLFPGYVKNIIYSVPSRLIGMMLKVHIYDDRLECYVGGDHTITLQRLRRHKKRVHYIDYTKGGSKVGILTRRLLKIFCLERVTIAYGKARVKTKILMQS